MSQPASASPDTTASVPQLRLLQITDTHLFSDCSDTLLGLDTRVSLRAVVDLACAEDRSPDLVLATGDLAQDASADAYGQLAEELCRLGAPVYWAPGNHDDQAVAARVLNAGVFAAERSCCLGNWQVILLDSTVPGAVGGRLAQAELERLSACLEAYPEHHALVCLHHQAVAVGSRWLDAIGLSNSADLLQVTDRFPQVRALLWGHAHQEYQGERNGVLLLGAPSTCLQFRPGSADFAIDSVYPGYRRVDLHADGRVETAVRRLARFTYKPDKGAVGY